MRAFIQRGLSAPLLWGFFLVFGLGAFLIFFKLGVPSLWLDEAASPLNARYPLPYIIELSRSIEEHPPLYYLLLKAVMHFGRSDALLRLPSAVSGLGCLVLTAWIGRRRFGWPAGLLAAALWLAMPQNLWLSRIARPYAFWLLLYCGSLLFLDRLLRDGKWRDLGLLLGVNAVMAATHYLSFPILAGEFACLVCTPTAMPRRRHRLAVGLYAAGLACVTAAAYLALIRFSHNAQEILGYADAPESIFPTLGRAIAGTLYYFDAPVPRLLWLAAVVAGCVVLWRRNRPAFGFLAPLVVVPLAVVVVLDKSTGLYSRHLSFLGILASLILAGAAASLPRLAGRLRLATLLVLGLAATDALTVHHQDFYTLHSYQVPIIGNNYKETANVLAAMSTPGTVISYSNDFFGNAVAWYLAQKPRPNPVADQRLTPADRVVHLLYVASTHHGYLARSDAAFRQRFGPDSAITKVDATTFYGLTVPRTPSHAFNALPAVFHDNAAFPGFFATAATIDGLRYQQNARSPAVVPTRNDRDAVAGFQYDNHAPAGPQDIVVNILYDNVGRDNRLAARVRFDDEPPVLHPLSTGYDAVHQRQLRLHRAKNYARLQVDVLLNCASRTPTEDGGNLETLRLRDVQTFICPARDGAACLHEADSAFETSLLDNFLSERFLPASTVPQHISPGTAQGLVEADGEGHPGWKRLVPSDPAHPGTLRLELTTDKPRLIFFPRLGLNSSIRILDDTAGGEERLLFGLRNPSPHWTPVSGQYELVVPPARLGRPLHLTIELLGPWAQLWQRDGALFF